MVSIIITLYNKENTIKRTILSALEQTYKDIEIIVVDDCSTDNSPNICNEFLPDIKVITTDKNYGLPNARQEGIKHARGNYITFIDADDYISKDAINKCIMSQKKSDADIVQMKIIRRLTKWGIPVIFRSNYDAAQALNACLYNEHLFPVQCCGKLYKSKLIKSATSIPYNGFWGEDRIFNLPIYAATPKIEYVPTAHYNYSWGGRTSSTFNLESLQGYKDVYQLKYNWALDNGFQQYTGALQNELIELLKYHIRHLINSKSMSKDVAIKYLQAELSQPFWSSFQLSSAEVLYMAEKKSFSRVFKKSILNIIG